jgi:4-amino-4-deoxy-L-arabinose transferase-like glycosyltransferase
VRELLRQHSRFFLLATLAAIALRLFFIFKLPAVSEDSRLYADIAQNWLRHGTYALTEDGVPVATYVRLPGYPAFLAAVFAVFSVDTFRAVMLLQVLVDIGTCLLIADIARRTASVRAAKAAFLLAAVCPFLANYSAAVLTETLEIFFTAMALDCAIAGMDRMNAQASELRGSRMTPWLGCGAALGAAILLRPDGGLLLASLLLYLGYTAVQKLRTGQAWLRPITGAMLLTAIAIVPLVPWTLRNLHTMHRFQPLAPRYANEEDEFVPMGFNRWVKTWMAEHVSVQEVYWNVPGDKVDPASLPNRAFDSPEQKQRTNDLFDAYNEQLHMTPDLDAGFAELARERIQAHPLRYYVWLPMARVADMWLRPRIELTPADPRWWEFNDERVWSVTAVAFGLINLAYLAMAWLGLLRWRAVAFGGMLLTYVVLRSLFLGTLENPEPRYTLECYPVVILLAAAALARRPRKKTERLPSMRLRTPKLTLVCLLAGILTFAGCKKSGPRVLEIDYVSAPQAQLRERLAVVSNRTGVVKNAERVEVLEKQKRFARVRSAS